ncbi:DnaJ domain-containing protein [Trichoderma sp. TUCIM 5745]
MAPCQVTDDYYQILGVLQSAGKDAIRASYKRLALLHHPDRNPNNPKATAQFQLIESAYSTLFDPDRRRLYDARYASIRAQRTHTADTSSGSNPPQRASDQKSKDSQTFKEQIERLGATLQQLNLRRSKLESELFEIKREYNRSRAALDKLQSEADKDAQEEVRRKSWLGYYFTARESEEEKEERQRRMLNNRAARTVREAELNSRQGVMSSKQRSIDALNEQIRQKNAEKDKLHRQERAREEAVRWEEMRQREAARREKERQERERQERERKEKERKEQERREKEREEEERRERERIEKIQRGLREMFEKLQKEQEPPRFRKPPQPKKAEKAKQANANTDANWGTKPNTRRRGNEFNSESTSSKQSAGATTSKTCCLHRSWWDREEGKHVCERCLTTTFRFAFRCPSCRTVACAKCRDVMKSKVCLETYII